MRLQAPPPRKCDRWSRLARLRSLTRLARSFQRSDAPPTQVKAWPPLVRLVLFRLRTCDLDLTAQLFARLKIAFGSRFAFGVTSGRPRFLITVLHFTFTAFARLPRPSAASSGTRSHPATTQEGLGRKGSLGPLT